MEDFTRIHGVADRLRVVRHRRGLSQIEMARRMQLGQSTWSAYESGGSNPSLAVLDRLSLLEGVNLHWLLTGEGDHGLAQPPHTPGSPETITRQQRLDAVVADVQAQLDNVVGWIEVGKQEAALIKAECLERSARLLVLTLTEELDAEAD